MECPGRIVVSACKSRVEEWQPVCYTEYYFSRGFSIEDKPLQRRSLRFNPIQVAEWLQDLSNRAQFGTTVALAKDVGFSRTRVSQCLNLLRIPEKSRTRLKAVEALTEYQLRPVVSMTPKHRAQAIRAILARIH